MGRGSFPQRLYVCSSASGKLLLQDCIIENKYKLHVLFVLNIHLIQKRFSSELLHCALLHTQTAMHHGCNKFVHCCMPRPQNIVVHIASMANTRISLSHSMYLQCYLKLCYIHGALRSEYATMRNAQMQQFRRQPFLN